MFLFCEEERRLDDDKRPLSATELGSTSVSILNRLSLSVFCHSDEEAKEEG